MDVNGCCNIFQMCDMGKAQGGWGGVGDQEWGWLVMQKSGFEQSTGNQR